MEILGVIQIIDARKIPDSLALDKLKESSAISIIKSESLRREWDSYIQSELTTFELTKLINSQAKRIGSEFVSALENLAGGKSIFWRATRTAEKNTLINPLFETLIVIHIILSHKYKSESKILVTDNPDLLFLLKKYMLRESLIKKVTLEIRSLINFFRLLSLFMIWFVGNLIVALRLPLINANIIIHTFVDEASGNSQIYEERYFPGLAKYYEDNGLSVSHLVSNAGNFPLNLFNAMNAQGYRVCNEFKFYRIFDLIFVARTVLKIRRAESTAFIVDGFDFQNVVNVTHLRYGIDLDVFKHILRFRFAKRLGNSLNPPKIVVTEFEGMIPEKMLNLGVSNSPVKTIGFQHGAMFEHLLCNYPTKAELELGLVSDKIICNGTVFQNLIASKGIPRNRLVTGSALRYKYLHKQSMQNIQLAQNELLVLLPMTTPDCLDLIKIVQDGLSDLQIVAHFKPHPLNNLVFLSQNIDLSRHSIVNDTLGNLVFDYKIITGMTTGALLEVSLLGLQVVKIQRQLSLDFDTTFMNPELRIQVDNAAEFRNAVISLRDNYLEDSRRINLKLMDEYFATVTPTGMAAFLP